ncbi:hypothetical protein AB0I94_36265 [Streptomyces sp. NPDC050147]|uniref:hypothetical protein n=1 Tax=Streptomyces sp. NPDC050147 TaxID=3155513 RepID=UPI00341499F8
MPSEEISQEKLSKIRGIAFQWAADHGGSGLRGVRVVATTRDSAIRSLGGPGVSSTMDPTYFVTFEGAFSWRTRDGIWAAVLIDQKSMLAGPYTIRPPGELPDFRMEDLGAVYSLDG